MFDVIYFHAVMLVRYVMSLIKATYLLTYLLTFQIRRHLAEFSMIAAFFRVEQAIKVE
jgi:hypothetical protein